MESLKKMVVRQFNELLGFTTEERNKLFVESLTSSINTKDSYLIAFLIMIFSFKWDQEVLGLLINHKATHQAFREDGFLFPFLSLFAESFCPKKGITIKAVPLGIVMSKMEFAWTETQSLRTLASRVIELVVVMMSWELALHPVTEFNSGLSKETHIPPELFMAGSQLENRERRLGKAMSDEMINYYYFYSTRHKEASKVPQANHFNGDLDLNTLPQQIDNIDLANLVDKRFMPPCILGIFNKHQADQLHAKHDERFALLYYYLPLVNRNEAKLMEVLQYFSPDGKLDYKGLVDWFKKKEAVNGGCRSMTGLNGHQNFCPFGDGISDIEEAHRGCMTAHPDVKAPGSFSPQKFFQRKLKK